MVLLPLMIGKRYLSTKRLVDLQISWIREIYNFKIFMRWRKLVPRRKFVPQHCTKYAKHKGKKQRKFSPKIISLTRDHLSCDHLNCAKLTDYWFAVLLMDNATWTKTFYDMSIYRLFKKGCG